MKIAVHGLGRMGMQIAQKLADAPEHTVIAHNRSAEKIDQAVQFGALPAYDKQAVIDAFAGEQVILWLMLPAAIVDEQLREWQVILPENSIIIDGGNSDYRLTEKRYETVTKSGHQYLDVGVSGGVWGYENGFSMMAGGNEVAYDHIAAALDTLALPDGAHDYFGPSGSGHYVKMVHNAIEYGMMQSLAEGYRMLSEGPFDAIDGAKAGEVWQHRSVVTSWLNEITRDTLKENPSLEGIDGVVAESGEARWTLETAKELGIPMPAIQAAFDVRLKSQKGNTNYATKLLAAMRNKFGGHALNDK